MKNPDEYVEKAVQITVSPFLNLILKIKRSKRSMLFIKILFVATIIAFVLLVGIKNILWFAFVLGAFLIASKTLLGIAIDKIQKNE